VRAGRAAILHGDLTLQEDPIKYRKCPTNETPAIFRLQMIDKNILSYEQNLIKTDEPNETKMQLSLTERSDL
jgi:hypothetical protein